MNGAKSPNPVSKKVFDFFSNYPEKHYSENQIILMPDMAPHGVIYIVTGLITQYDVNQKGEKLIINTFKPGAYLPMSWAINQTPNQYFFESSVNTVVKIAPHEDTIEFLKLNPDILYDLLSRVYRGADGILRNLLLLMGGSAKKRIFNELITYAHRFGSIDSDNSYHLNITESEIASRTGLSRETVSRELHDIKKSGIISINRGKIRIHSLEKLNQESNRAP